MLLVIIPVVLATAASLHCAALIILRLLSVHDCLDYHFMKTPSHCEMRWPNCDTGRTVCWFLISHKAWMLSHVHRGMILE